MDCKDNWLTQITKKVIHRVPDLAFQKNEQLREDLINDAFTQIMIHSQANSYERQWDNLLVNCVVTLYNYLGTEGSVSRTADGISDSYDSSNILSPLLSRNIAPYLRPAGYVYSKTRFDYPD